MTEVNSMDEDATHDRSFMDVGGSLEIQKPSCAFVNQSTPTGKRSPKPAFNARTKCWLVDHLHIYIRKHWHRTAI